MSFNLSPEEILREKEVSGGLVFDSLEVVQQETTNQIVQPTPQPLPQQLPTDPVKSEIKTVVNEQPEYSIPPRPIQSIGDPVKIPSARQVNTENSLGQAQMRPNPMASENGWKNVPVGILPSKGIFYPEGTLIAIRASEVSEIRHFSTIDETDSLDIEEKLSYITERCLRMEFRGEGVVSYKDLKQEDRFFLIMTIRDLTFIKGENSILLKTKKKCKETIDCPFNNGIELRTGALTCYEIDQRILNYYDPNTRGFNFILKKTGKPVQMFVPSIGVTQAISSFVLEAINKSINMDDGFLQIAPFLFDEWRGLTFQDFISKMRESDYWTKEEYSLLFGLSDMIRIGTKAEAKQVCPKCSAEVTADITFPGGIRSLFVISNIFGELL